MNCCILADKEIISTSFASERAEWRAWLERHHATDTEVWLVYYKKGSGKPTVKQSRFQHGITYLESPEEALTLGGLTALSRKLTMRNIPASSTLAGLVASGLI